MENPETFKENVGDYIETKIEIIKLKAIDKSGAFISRVIVAITLGFIGVFVLLLLSFSAAYAIAEVSGRNSIGFLSIGGLYVLLAIVIYAFREKIVTVPVINSLLKKYYLK